VARQLDTRGIGYLHAVEPRIKSTETIGEVHDPVAARHLRAPVAARGFTKATPDAIIEAGHADIVAIGRHFIANPDLPERLRLNLPLDPYDRSTFCGGDARG
jgi:N-ethylmaleimide reductase